MNSNQNEILIGEVVTNKDGEWSLNVPIQANGSYQFNVYENYMQTNQTMQSLNIDIKLNQADVSLNLAPNPYNPKKGPLYIEYILNEPCRVDIGIYSIAGFKIDEKTFEHKQDGRHIIQWSLLPTPPPGLYVVVLKASGKKTVIKSKRLGVQW